jgi:superfamily II DNA or RNA helicase
VKEEKEERVKWLYIVAGERNTKNGMVTFANVGDAYSVEERMKDVDYSRKAAGGAWTVLKKWEIGQLRDHDLRPSLNKYLGEPDPSETGNTEEYAFNCSIEEAIRRVGKVVNGYLHGTHRRDSYEMRPEQKECCDKAVDYFSSGGNRFLINAKPRFGKTFTSYEVMREMGLKKVLILTYKPQVEDSWAECIEEHVHFKDYSWHNAKDGAPTSERDSSVTFCSMQQMLNKEGGKKVSYLFKQNWDMIIFDEEHYGSKTINSEEALARLQYDYRLDLSGTPFKSISSGLFLDESRYDWTFIDEQVHRMREEEAGWRTEIYRSLPPMMFHTISIHPDVVKEAEGLGFSGDDAFRIEKFLGASNGEFENPMLVKLFLDSITTKTKDGCWSPWHAKAKNATKLMDHILMILPPSVDSVKAFTNMLKEHTFFSSYHVINASGSGKEVVTDIEGVKSAIKRHDKTITVSCGRFNTGVTVPEWGAVFLLDGGKSPEVYIQTIFRCQSPWVVRDKITGKIIKYEKENCLVFDFNPQRTLELIYEYAMTTAPRGKSIQETLIQFFEVASIMEHGENKFVERTVDDILAAVIRSNCYIERFASARGINTGNLNEHILESWANIKGKGALKLMEQLTDNGMEKGAIGQRLTPAQEKKAKKEKKKAKSIAKKMQEKAQSILSRVPAFLWISSNKNGCCQDIIDNNERLFKTVTGSSVRDFKEAIDSRFLNENWINRCIEDFRINEQSVALEDFLNGDESAVYKLLSRFERDGKEETPGTPIALVNNMLNKLPPETWTDPSKKFLDPACSTGTFLLEIIRRLNKGLEQSIPNQDERLRHIVENMIYGAEPQEVPFLMTKSAFSRLFNYKFNLFRGIMTEGIKELDNMKFDIVVMNPPYQSPQKADGKRGGGDLLWNKFVEISLDKLMNVDGKLLAVHPSGWRKPESERSKFFGMFKMLTHDNHMEYLEIHDTSDGMKTFGAGTRYDWYVIQKGVTSDSGIRSPTIVLDERGCKSQIDLSKWEWLPNHSFDKVKTLMGSGAGIIFDVSNYETRKKWTSETQDSKFRYRLVHSTPKKGNRFYWASRNDKGHFGIPKVIFGDGGLHDVIIDELGTDGMTQHAMALPIIDRSDGDKAKQYLLSDEFKNILNACSWSNFQIDWRMFSYFREGFWR